MTQLIRNLIDGQVRRHRPPYWERPEVRRRRRRREEGRDKWSRSVSEKRPNRVRCWCRSRKGRSLAPEPESESLGSARFCRLKRKETGNISEEEAAGVKESTEGGSKRTRTGGGEEEEGEKKKRRRRCLWLSWRIRGGRCPWGGHPERWDTLSVLRTELSRLHEEEEEEEDDFNLLKLSKSFYQKIKSVKTWMIKHQLDPKTKVSKKQTPKCPKIGLKYSKVAPTTSSNLIL